jgi:P-type Cu2+ transporter
MSAASESSLRIEGIHCAACSGVIEEALRRVPGVIDAQVSAAARCVRVRWDAALTQASALVAAIEGAGYRAVPDNAAEARAARRAEGRRALWRLFVAAFCAMQVMMLATPAYVSAPGELPADQKQLLDWGSWLLTLPVLWFSAAPFFGGAWRALRQRRIGMDVPVALGIAVAFVASSGAALDPGGLFGHEVYFDSLTMFVAFLLGGRWLEMRMRHGAEAQLEDATERLPQSVLRLAPDGSVERVPAGQLQPGDRVRVPSGEVFAADGVVDEGATAADEALLSGESHPVAKAPGAAVVAGSMNLVAPVVMTVERCGADTRYEAIVALMRAARGQRPALLASADRWAAPFLAGVLLLAAGAAAAWSFVDPSRALWVAVSVLIVTCPCALSLAAPSALLAAAGAMGRRGVLLRRLDAIESLARFTTLFVDKTGTLTEGRLRCVGMRALELGDWGAVAASLAAWSSHPVAAALQQAYAPAATAWQRVREQPGRGLEAVDDSGRHWRLGSARWAAPAGLQPAGGTEAWLACDGRPLARFAFDEQLRGGTREALHALQADGVRVALLSGDEPERARRIGRALGLAHAEGGLAPEAKLRALQAAQATGERVAMVGDGINDAPVLAQADVSLAMGEGASIARAQADGVLVANRLQDLAWARGRAQAALKVVRQNLAWAAAYNAACVPLALAGYLPPWAAGLGMAASSLFVVINSLRLGR